MTRKKSSKVVADRIYKTEELVSRSSHVWYEYSMMNEVADSLTSGTGDDVVRNALLESFLIHARSVADFLWGTTADKPDDIRARHYLVHSTSASSPLSPPSVPVDWRTRVNKEIAHLTDGRLAVTPETKGWRFNLIREELDSAMGAFLEIVPPQTLSPEWKAVLAHRPARLASLESDTTRTMTGATLGPPWIATASVVTVSTASPATGHVGYDDHPFPEEADECH